MRLGLSCLATTLLLGALVSPAGVPSAGTPPAPPVLAPAGPTGVLVAAADPLATDLQRAIERHAREYAALHRQLVQAREEREAFAIQRELRANRTSLQVEMLRIQAAYARRAGREDLAWEFERTIEALVRPEPRAADDDGR
ncbi:MAG: hypothetical protein U0704_11600 [Candidatus Eisenbacteria bacterium]